MVTSITSTPKTRLFEIISTKSVILGESGENIVSTKNVKSKWLLDLRRTFMDAEGLELSAQLFWRQMQRKFPFQVGGLEAGSVPLVAAILLEGRRQGFITNGFFIRKERKPHGRQQLIEGILDKHPIVVVDDLFNGGGTLNKVVVALAEMRRKVAEAFVIVDYENPIGEKLLHEKKIKLNSIFALSDLGLSKSSPKPKQISKFEYGWRFAPLELGHFHVVPKSSPALDTEKIYFGSDASIFWALSQKTGKPVWSFQAGRDRQGKGIFSSPALHRGRVYFGSYDGNVYCLDTKSGKELWRFAEAEWVGSSPAIAADLGMLFIGLEHNVAGKKGSIVALDLETGKKVWDYTVKEWLHGSPTYCCEKGLVAIGTNDSIFYLFRAKDGKKLWEFHTSGPIKYAPTFDLKRNSVIFGCHDGRVYILDLDSGKELWSIQTGDVIYSTPLIVGDRCFVTSTDKKLYILDLIKKKLLKEVRVAGRILATPVALGNKIYFGATDGRVYELDSRKLEITGSIQFPERITNAIRYSLKRKTFYALTYDNQLFSFKKLNK
ncbi:MAG: PQQ-binding-like beta-propeller repeat protein [Candidatus Gracilibacteria bacterium]|jgi:outer membrane protein assembly factor BamB/orotate phosphoribosyltransferase